MKAQELRRGNLIQNRVNKTIEEVNSIHDSDRIGTNSNGNGYAYYWEGIPLTEKWLEDFGFHEKYKSVSNRWLHHPTEPQFYVELHDPEDEDTGKLQGRFIYDHRFEIGYVHQLQNLYFALTGEELTLKKQI